MAKQSLETIKSWFRTALKPTQAQFWDTWDSFWHKDEKIPTASVTGLDDALTSKASTELVNYLRTEVEAFESGLASKLDRGGYAGTAQDLNTAIQQILLVLASDDTTLDELQEIVNYIKQNKQVLDTLGVSNIAGLQAALDGKVDKVAGKQLSTEDFTTVLKNKLDAIDMASKLDRGGYAGTAQDLSTAIQNILAVLASDDTTLDELQEIVNFIKQNKQVLDTLGISNIAGLQAALDKTVTADAALTAGRIPVVAANGRKLADSQLYVDGDIVRGARGIAFGDAAEIVDDGSANCSMSLWQRLTISVYDDVADAMNYFDFTKQGALYLKQLVANKLSISEGAGAGKTLRSDAVGTAKWVGAESIEVLTNTLDFSKGDLYVKTLYGDTTLAISNPIPGKTILLIVTGNGYTLNLPGIEMGSSAGYNAASINYIYLTCTGIGTCVYSIDRVITERRYDEILIEWISSQGEKYVSVEVDSYNDVFYDFGSAKIKGSGGEYHYSNVLSDCLSTAIKADRGAIIGFFGTGYIYGDYGALIKEISFVSPMIRSIHLLQVPNLQKVNNSSTVIDLSQYTALKSFMFGGASVDFQFILPNSMSNLSLQVYGFNSTVDLPNSIDTDSFVMSINGSLTATNVNSILAKATTWAIPTGRKEISLTGANAAPTGQGLTDKAALIAAGWTVTTN